ncbi:CPBP family intramembrane glutamic endopeptidase [Priestia koreensis]|uniref:CPBP family intramembrane glutamic endopeptidase n=1 Tax=Priestia koreensis TaxID=284581 RepID=UPI0028F6FFEC|nr:CPBP family intramembrane glutamic endopeptidase [Priestia koreensis]
MALLFFGGIMSIAYQNVWWSLAIATSFVLIVLFNKANQFLSSLLLSFLLGFLCFTLCNVWVDNLALSNEMTILLKRLMLFWVIVLPVCQQRFFKKPVSWYNHKPNWNEPMVIGKHKIHTRLFLLIGVLSNSIVYFFFIVQQDRSLFLSLLWFCIAFSLINAVFEEVIWRGVMLSALQHVSSLPYAIILTSVGFGLLHLSIGFPLLLSLLISGAGIIYAVLTIKTNSIYPAIAFHLVINIGMVYSGFIIE